MDVMLDGAESFRPMSALTNKLPNGFIPASGVPSIFAAGGYRFLFFNYSVRHSTCSTPGSLIFTDFGPGCKTWNHLGSRICSSSGVMRIIGPICMIGTWC